MGWAASARNVVKTLVISILRLYALRADTDDATTIYIGQAEPGTGDATAKWRLMKIDTSVITADIKWASGNDAFDKQWTKRKDGTYTYI